ncbi:unnamed protein product, partial [Ectocarpus sp. 6 AP-2014]
VAVCHGGGKAAPYCSSSSKPYAQQRCPRCAHHLSTCFKSYARGTLFPFSNTFAFCITCLRSAFFALVVDITKPPLLAICGRLTCSSMTAVSIFCTATNTTSSV